MSETNLTPPSDILAYSQEQMIRVNDALIADVYFNTPRSAPFILKCTADGKYRMSQLTEEDIDNIVNIRGIGLASANNLKKIYTDYFDSLSSIMDSPFKKDSSYSAGLIDSLPLSAKTVEFLMKSGIFSFERLLSMDKKELLRIKNMGGRVFQDVQNLREAVSLLLANPSNTYYIKNIATQNRLVPIPMLRNIGVHQREINILLKNNSVIVGDLCDRGLTYQEYSIAHMINRYFSVPVTRRFTDAIDALKDNAKACLSRRCVGTSLGEIGKEMQVTHERVRQVLAKTTQKLMGISELVASILFSSNKACFTFSDLINIFRSERTARFCKYILQSSEYVYYLAFSDCFIKASVCGPDIEDRLKRFTDEVIGRGINFSDNIEFIESELEKHDLYYLNATNIKHFLVHKRYRFYGDYVLRGNRAYSIVCHDAIVKYYKFDIKLDSEEGNSDLRLLRQIVAKHYQGMPLPTNNRALTAGLTRDPSKFVLSGRGRYCPVEKVVYNISIFDDISKFISDSAQTSFYYSELFSHFKERLLAETNVDNSYFLHGMLKYLYPNEFAYEKDLLSKVGENRQDIDDRLSKILYESGHSMSKSEIKRSIPGINDFVIMFSVLRLPDVIQWDYNEFNHTSNLNITDEDKNMLSDTLAAQTKSHYGYTSDNLLFNAVSEISPDFLARNSVVNSRNLYYIASYLFENDYRFKRPHILAKEFPVREISTSSITQALLNCETRLNFKKYTRLATRLGWAIGSIYSIFSEMEKDFMRISINDYVRKTSFRFSQSSIEPISNLLSELVDKSGYLSLNSMSDFQSFPVCPYKWNSFLLESIIAEYDMGFRIITPQIQDRRYQRGIVVRNESPYNTYEELVLGCLISDDKLAMTENELLEYLRAKKLISTCKIPQELYNCPGMPLKNEVFTVKK